MLRRLGGVLGLLLLGLSLTGFSRLAVPLAERESTPWWIWFAIFAVLVAFFAFGLWWWLRSGTEEEAPAVSSSQKSRMLEPTAAKETVQDDLKRIEGIGPKISSVLKASGIATFAQLSQTSVERIREILETESPNLLRLADPTTWPEQAALAAQREWKALEKLQDELKGGRRA